MRRSSGSDNLAHSFTDLMTSLMVIFILLLLVFVSNQASITSVTAQSLLGELRAQLEPAGFKKEDLRIDPKDPSTILLTLMDAQLTFEPNSYQLRPEGEQFLETRMPKIAAALCADKYRGAVEAVVVEGHSDNAPYRGLSAEESQTRNLRLSQERSMEVVERTLFALKTNPAARGCLLEKISATGRGEQDLAETADKSRRTLIKIRVNATHAMEFAKLVNAGKVPVRMVPVPTATTNKILDLFARLQAVPRQTVSFRLSDDEVNEYLAYALLVTPRPCIGSINVRFYPHNYVATSIVIDFDDIERWSPGLVPSFMGLTGKKPVSLDFRFSTGDRTATYTIEKALYDGRNIPHFLADKIVQILGAHQAEGVDADRTVMLPFGLRSVHTEDRAIEGAN